MEFPVTVKAMSARPIATVHEKCRGPLEYKYTAYAVWGLQDRTSPVFEEFARDRFIIGDTVSVKEEIALPRATRRRPLHHALPVAGVAAAAVLDSIRRLGEIFA